MLPHRWDLAPKEAIAIQRELASEVIRRDNVLEVCFIAGIDVAINKSMARAAVVLMSYPELAVLEQHVHEEPVHMPYIPGLLSFREMPSMLGAFSKLRKRPDLVMVDGAGIAHPRRLGIASHLGLLLQIPTIGCAKSRLVGLYDEAALSKIAGSSVLLQDKNEIVGAVVRTKTCVRPLFISLGHLISLETSICYVLSCTRGYRLPEPTRQADKLSKSK